jgi:hypothetical protein
MAQKLQILRFGACSRVEPAGRRRSRPTAVVLGGSGGESKAGDHPRRVDGHEQAKAFVPSQAIGPPDVGVASKPSLASALRVANGHRRGVQSLVAGVASGILHERQVQGDLLDEAHAPAHQPVELRAIGQGGEGVVQAPSSVAVEVAFAAEAAPPSEDDQGDYLGVGEGSFGAGSLFRRMGVAEVVDDDLECSEEGVHIEHGSVPFPWGSGGKPTLVRGHLPLKLSVDNSHQAFKRIQPTTLAGLRESISAPTSAHDITSTAKSPEEASKRSDSIASVMAPARSAPVIVHTDQASQATVRVLTAPTPRLCSLAPCVTTPLYSTTVSQALRQTLRGSFR